MAWYNNIFKRSTVGQPAQISVTLPAPVQKKEHALSRSQRAFNSTMALHGQELKAAREQMTRGYEAAAYGRILGTFRGSYGHINDQIRNAHGVLMARARELEQNTPVLKNILSTFDTSVVGPNGFTLKTITAQQKEGTLVPNVKNNDVVDEHFKRWSKKGVCDVTGQLSFKSICSLALREKLVIGGCLIRKHRSKPTKQNPYGFALQILPLQELDRMYNTTASAEGNRISMGVEIDAFGRPVRYHFDPMLNQQTYSGAHAQKYSVPASEIIHFFDQQYPEQLHGITAFAPVMKQLHQLAAIEEYMLVKQRMQASYSAFVTREKDTNEDGSLIEPHYDAEEDGNYYQMLDAGLIMYLNAGEKVEPFIPSGPDSGFDAFLKSVKRSVANGLCISYNAAFQDMSDTNFSSMRQAFIQDRDVFKMHQAHAVENLCNSVYEAWVKEAFLNGALEADDGYRVPDVCIGAFLQSYKFQARSFPYFDPAKDALADQIFIELGVKTPAIVAEQAGYDLWANLHETAEIQRECARLGVPMPGTKPAPSVVAQDTPTDPEASDGEGLAKALKVRYAKRLRAVGFSAEEIAKIIAEAEIVDLTGEVSEHESELNPDDTRWTSEGKFKQ